MTKRYIDSNGYLEVRDNPLTKVGVFPYMGHEINAPEPNRVYQVYRSAEAVQEAAESFKLMPLVNDHEWLGKEGTPAEKKGVLGVIGQNVYFDYPYLRGNIKIHADIAQDLINTGKIELSAGYKCTYEPETGEFEGQPYDYIQRGLCANHLALVQEGRSGPDVKVIDSGAIITIDTRDFVKMNLEELLAAVAALSDEDKAKLLAALAPAATDEDPEGEKPTDDDDPTEDTEPVDEAAAESAATTAEEAAEIVVEAAEAAAEAAATGEPAAVEQAEAAVEIAAEKLDEVKAELSAATMDSLTRRLKLARRSAHAMDAAAVVKMLGKRDALAKRLAAHVGVFDHSAMTIAQVAQYGCKQLGIKAPASAAVVALDAALQVRVADSAKKTVDSAAVQPGDIAKFWKE